MVTTPPELLELRDLWSTISGQGRKSSGPRRPVTQTQLAQRTETIAHLVPGQDGALSKAYISQMLNARLDRNPKREPLVTMALAMSALYRSMREQLPPETREVTDHKIQDLLLALRVRDTSWTDPEFPLSAYSENLIVQEAFEQQLNSNFQNPGFTISLSGGYRQGKSTAIARALDRLRVLGYEVEEISINTMSLERIDTAAMYQQFTTALGITAAEPSNGVEFDRVIERWLAQKRSSRVVLVIDDVNVLLDAATASALPRAILRGWGTRIRRSPDNSPWRKLSLLVASTYSPDIVGSVALSSRAPTLTDFPVEDLDPEQTLQLMELWIEHVKISETTSSVPKQPDPVAAKAVVERYAGQPYLVHAAVKNWTVTGAAKGTSIVVANAGVEAEYSDTIERLVGTARLSKPDDQTQVDSLDNAKSNYVVAAPGEALANLGLVRDGCWASPFVESAIAARLPRAR